MNIGHLTSHLTSLTFDPVPISLKVWAFVSGFNLWNTYQIVRRLKYSLRSFVAFCSYDVDKFLYLLINNLTIFLRGNDHFLACFHVKESMFLMYEVSLDTERKVLSFSSYYTG